MLIDDYGYVCTEIRVLPTGGSSNILCSKRGYDREIAYRIERNKDLGTAFKFRLPTWESLEVYAAESD